MKNKKNLMNMRIKKKRIVKQIYIVLASILCMLCIMSCDNRQSTEMIYSVNTLNAPISCVSSAKNGHYYVGFENGNIARVETNDNSWNIIHGKYIARIYDIVEENDTTLWVGIRDKGLVKMVRDSIVTSYSIGKNYAPYDICKNEKGDVYIATSSGIYQLVDDSLILISTEEKYKEYKINQLCIYNDSMLYAATEKGVLILKKKNEKYETSLIDLIPEGIIFHFHRSKDLLYATSEEKVYVIDMKTAQAKPVETKSEDNLFAYFTETVDTNAHWELTATSMNYWDKNGCSSFLIPGRLNRSYKNYIFILNDDFIILSFEYQLYTISRHQNTKGESVHVIATHIYKDSIKNSGKDILYFITNDNYLYSCPLTHSELIPKKIGKHKLEIDEVIIKLGSSKYFLWVITNNCLRQIDRKTGKLITCIEFDNGTDLRCMYVDSKCLFIGSRKWLFRINNPDNRKITKEAIDTLKTNASIRDADLYVTDIYKKINGFYFATLNNGLCILNSDTVTPINSYKDVGNINKIGYLMNVGVYLYTSTGFLLQKQNVNEKNNITFKNIPIIDYHNQYISTILERKIDGGLFVIGYKGIGMVNFEMDTFSEAAKMSFLDMQFKDAAISEYNETLFLGDRTGIYRYNYGNNASLIPVKIPEPFHVPNIILIPVIVIIVILLISLCLYFFVTKYIKKKKIIDQNKKLISRILETLEKYKYLSNDLMIEEKFKKIQSQLESISINSSYDILDEIINISEQLFGVIKEVIDQNKKLISRILETLEKYKYLSNDLMIEEKSKKIQSQLESISINSSYDILDEIINISEQLFGVIKEVIDQNKKLISRILETLEKYKYLSNDLMVEEKFKKIQSQLESISINSSYDILDEIINISEQLFGVIKEVIDQNKKLISRILETLEKYKYLSDDLIIEERLKKIQSELESISINSSYDTLDEIININEQLFDIIGKYLSKQSKDLEKKLDEDLEKIEELVKPPAAMSYKDLKQICNPFIEEYDKVFLSEIKFMKVNNIKAFNAILICTKTENERIDEILEQRQKNNIKPKFRHASTYYDEIENACKRIKSNYFADKLLKRIEARRCSNSTNTNTNKSK